MIKKTLGEKIFGVFNTVFLFVVAFVCVYPLIYVVSASLSSPEQIANGNVLFFPKGFTVDAYKKVIERRGIWMAYGNSFYYMIVGGAVQMFVTILGAYALSKTRLIGRKFLNLMASFSMWFSAGVIPMYLTFKDYGLLNTRSALIFGFACNAYNFILLRTYFAGIPSELEEAAKVDGANDFCTMWKIFIPLALPSIATIALFYAVTRWNGYIWPMLLMKEDSKIPLQVVLKKLVVDMSGRMDSVSMDSGASSNFSEESVMYATMVMAIVPMMLLYPFIQRFFVKGATVGAVKG